MSSGTGGLRLGERSYDGIWTYSLEDVRTGLQYCFAELKMNVKEKYDTVLTTTGAIGISAMMHGYLPFDKDNWQLCEFRTWRSWKRGFPLLPARETPEPVWSRPIPSA